MTSIKFDGFKEQLAELSKASAVIGTTVDEVFVGSVFQSTDPVDFYDRLENVVNLLDQDTKYYPVLLGLLTDVKHAVEEG